MKKASFHHLGKIEVIRRGFLRIKQRDAHFPPRGFSRFVP